MKLQPLLIACTFVAAAGLALFLLFQRPPPMHNPMRAPIYAYDLNSRTLFVVPGDTQFPCRAPSGDLADTPKGTPAGVHVLAVRSPDGKVQAGVLTRYQPVRGSDGETMMMVRDPADAWWHPEESPEGRAVVQRVKALKAKGWTIDVRPPKEAP